jgi:hypothetical protein
MCLCRSVVFAATKLERAHCRRCCTGQHQPRIRVTDRPADLDRISWIVAAPQWVSRGSRLADLIAEAGASHGVSWGGRRG